ncbi:Acg family FMN-binding oxidoreductase [Paractinoplanes durhamensis]|uniref:NAD(P)H nitroreductase n=1 Tax=Paractinoplanes durhamensis TaxID=113563 RepID=A0ABQ3Z460_9ACTN|nr:nitroreductase [Actinoplanes durhamensis]GIE04334.1 NAD(P)H nitroreductase [Actinoplanes durhamensis]
MTALEDAAGAAQHAPSVFNTQPWSWRVIGDSLELYADPSRRLDTVDRDGRLLLLSCGAALHHARVALAAAGHQPIVERLARPDLLARVTLGAPTEPDAETKRIAAAIYRRRTDRRAFGDKPVPETELTALRRLVESEGAYLHVVRPEQLPELAVTAELASHAEQADPAYRAELDRWTTRPDFTGDGVPPATAVRDEPRRVPVRLFAPGGDAGLAAGPAHDAGAAYVVLFGTSDEPAALLRGGEALSALLLRATADGLATAPISDAIEVEWPRTLLRGILAGLGDPYLVVRLGFLPADVPLPSAPRRDPRDVITIVE